MMKNCSILLQQAHLTRVLVGFESLNPASLEMVNKHQNVSDIKKCAETLSRYQIKLIVSLVLGIDSDGKEDINRSVKISPGI